MTDVEMDVPVVDEAGDGVQEPEPRRARFAGRLKLICGAAAAMAVLAVLLFVWPTLYIKGSISWMGLPIGVRVNRITGQAHMRFADGWKKLEADGESLRFPPKFTVRTSGGGEIQFNLTSGGAPQVSRKELMELISN